MESPLPRASDVALCVEGGGMRLALTGALVCALQEAGLTFDLACGISAGASVTANFVAETPWRTRAMFVDAVHDEPGHFEGWAGLVKGHGYFDADYLYEGCIADGSYPFDFERFEANPANWATQAFEADTGRTAIWQKSQLDDAIDMASHVRASSTMPLLMNPIEIDGHLMYDGGLGKGAGLPFTIAQALGYERFVMVASQEAGYRKSPVAPWLANLYFRWAKENPLVAKALLDRPAVYNETLDELDRLEAAGQALVIHPESMPLKNITLDYESLDAAWKAGFAQGQREVDRVKSFLEG